jgi:PAS domain S-box-containing protein
MADRFAGKGAGTAGDGDLRFRAAVEAAPLGMHFYRLEPDGRLVFIGSNPAADRILGMDHAACLGKTIEKAFPPLAATEVPDRYRQVARDGVPWHSETVTYQDERVVGAYEVDAFPVAPGEVVAVFQDVTVRIRDAAVLARERQRITASEALHRALVQSVPVVQWTTDREGRFTLSEGLGLAALGLRPSEVVGRTVAQVYASNQGVLSHFGRALAGETFVTEDRIGAITFESHWGPIRDDGGGVVGVAGVALDVTARRRLQEQVHRAQKLDLVGKLAGGLAHDLNNLLMVVRSCAEALREDTGAGLPAAADDVDQILEAGQRAGELIRQLLAFGRQQVASPEPVDLGHVLEANRKMLRRILGEQVELAIEAEPGLWPVWWDRGHVEQVLLNLALNARDAMPSGGRLEVAARNVAPRDGEGERVRLMVRDTGTGMSEEVKAHLFEPFFSTKPASQGTGLGLATVYGLVAQGGGQIQVVSEPGRGTAFEISLPRWRGDAS